MSKSRSVLVALPFIAGVASGMTVFAGSDGIPECILAERWVTAHSGALPNSLHQLKTFSLPFRKAIYGSLPRADQLKLWHEQFATVLASTELSRDQREFVIEVDRDFDRYFGAENRRQHEDYAKRAAKLFGETTAKAIFATLGGPTSMSGVASTQQQNCNCHSGSEVLSCGLDWCIQGGGGCISKPTGCGWGWCYTCDGICVDPEQ